MKKLSVIVVLGLTLLTGNSIASSIDPWLQIVTNEAFQANLGIGHEYLTKVAKDGELGLFIQADPSTLKSYLMNRGMTYNSEIGDIFTAELPLLEVRRLMEQPWIQRIELSKPVKLLNNEAVQTTSVAALREDPRYEIPLKGDDVIFGILDTGIDYDNDDFKDSEGNTRIIGIWAQDMLGIPPDGFDYGHFCTSEAIINGTCPQLDEDGHGTHVSGTAAGSDEVYGGMAPNADILMVQLDFGSDEDMIDSTFAHYIIDGAKFIYDYATQLGKPVVINASVGTPIGTSYDGTSLAEQALDRLLVGYHGRAFVAAAGNEGFDSPYHYIIETTSEPKMAYMYSYPISYTMTVSGGDMWFYANEVSALDIALVTLVDDWEVSQYSESNEIVITLDAPGDTMIRFTTQHESGNVTSTFFIAWTSFPESNNVNVSIYVYNSISTDIEWVEVYNGFQLDIEGKAHLWVYGYPIWYEDGIAKTAPKFNRTKPLAQQIDELYATYIPDYLYQVDFPTCVPSVICVGSYVNRESWINCAGSEQYMTDDYDDPLEKERLSTWSSHGPTRDGRMKPDIVAPGEGVISTLSEASREWVEYYSEEAMASDCEHVLYSGTSMASPVIAGIVALMFQANPLLTSAKIQDILHQTASINNINPQDLFPPDDGRAKPEIVWPNPYWGYGRIDALNAVQRSLNIDNSVSTKLSITQIQLGMIKFIVDTPEPIDVVQLFDLAGKLVYNQKSIRPSSNNDYIITPEIGSGIYWLKVKTAGNEYAGKTLFVR